ncbi:fatty acid-binding protein DegV [Neobacillus niacini]|nr:fatty acid-binding protein DegV [Neobacillus niacini]
MIQYSRISDKIEQQEYRQGWYFVMKIAVVTDSTAYIPKELRDKWKIHMVPLNVIFGNEAYQEEVDLSAEEFYQEVKQKGLPTTSQPPVGQPRSRS